MNVLPYGFRIVGSPRGGERRLVEAACAFAAYAECDDRAVVEREAYLSAFQFGEDFREYLDETGSTKGFDGACWAPWLWWDVGRAGDLASAKQETAGLVVAITDRYELDDDNLLIFFSGSKGFHIGLPTCLWQPAPCEDFNRIARAFCGRVAASHNISIDVSIYDKVRAFRAPNSRHPKTGLHKRLLALDDLMHLSVEGILKLAEHPASFDIPAPTEQGGSCPARLDWEAAAEEVRQQAEARRQGAPSGTARLNRLTLEFVREGTTNGERATRLFAAAANLAEFGCPPELAHALLAESALDSGLTPSEVRRQIECGLERGGQSDE